MPTSEPEIAEDVITDPHFCAKCKHLLGIRHNPDNAENWHCCSPYNVIKGGEYLDLVTGISKYLREYHEGSLYILREDPKYCGPEGKWYEEYIPPVRTIAPSIGGRQAVELEIAAPFSETQLEDGKKAAADRVAALKARKKLSERDLQNL